MTRMKAADAAVLILEKEGATQAFGLPGAAINPFYAAMRRHALESKTGGVKHVLARHVEAASHMAEG
ncbi:thiamine pyrophosphate-binding protein, partial [Streptococcus oralis]